MSNVSHERKRVIERVIDGDGKSSSQQRRAAFDAKGPERVSALIEKIATRAYQITDDDIAAVKAAGFSEDQIYELAVCAALGQANRQLDNALAALDAATKE